MDDVNVGLLSSLTEKPPSDLMDCDELDGSTQSIELNHNDSLVENISEVPLDVRSVQMKNFASDPLQKKETIEEELNNGRASSEIKLSSNSNDVTNDVSPSITPVLRRSSRANKGIGKEIFDPSYIPSSKKKFHEPRRFDSPNTERNSSSASSTAASPRGKRGRIVVGECPRRRKMKNLNKSIVEKKLKRRLKQADKDFKRKKKTEKSEITKPISIEDFSDDDDNVPLKKLKADDVPADNNDDDDDDKSETSSSDEDSDDSYNNPARLWCICKKPHGNKFMISCDQCEDWFHGECVGISLQQGKVMEENNEDYVCPKCLKVSADDSPYEPESNDRNKERTTSESIQSPKRSFALDQKLQSRKNLKGYALFGQDNESSGRDKSSSKLSETQNKPKVRTAKSQAGSDSSAPSSNRKCIVSSCDKDALHGSVYCSNQCILKHAKESLKTVVKEKEKAEGKSLKESKEGETTKSLNPNKRIPVICRKTRKILSGPAAPRRKNLVAFLKRNPTYKVYKQKPVEAGSKPVKVWSNKDNHKPPSSDFFKHVENQQRKRDRYGSTEYSSTIVKKANDVSSVDKKHHVVKPVSKSVTTNPYKLNNLSGKLLQTNKTDQALKSKERILMKKNKRETEGYKSMDRRDSKDRKRKHSLDPGNSFKKVERSLSTGEKTKSDPKPNAADVRQNVKKSLFDILRSRSENSDDLKMHPDSIMRLATKVEDSLFKVYDETNTKYRNKYRSMMFNLKDPRNHGLWRKVIIGEVTSSEFVLMTAEQMASKKLAEWRKNELTQELDIIQKQEKEIANIRPVAKITHKGEIAIQEDLSDFTGDFSHRESTSAPSIAPARKKRLSISEEDLFDDPGASLPTDTTPQHSDHLFDLNCKICTGKMKEEDLEQNEVPGDGAKKVKRSTSIILSSEAQKATNSKDKNSAPKSHIVISADSRELKKKKKKKHKKTEESNINSHDPSLSPTTFLSNLSKEKKKKKPILPAPPPLSDIADPEPNQETSSPPDNDVTAAQVSKLEPKEPPKPSPPPPTNKAPSPEPPPKPNKSKLIWSGSISMLELSTFNANVYPVNGCCDNLDIDLPVRLVLGGRIHPKVVWEYLGKISLLPNKQLSVVRFHAASDDDRVGYVAMLSYFSSRKRFGVVNNQDRMLVKDMYLLPLLESHAIPEELIRCSPGIEQTLPSSRPSMLIGIVVRQVAVKPLKPISSQKSFSRSDPIKSSSPVDKDVGETPPDDNEEYIPDEDPPLKDKSAPALLLTDEELAAKTIAKPQSSGSLLERNRSLAPSLRFFMRKQSEEEQSKMDLLDDEADDDRPYSPGEDITKDADESGDYDPEEGIVQEEEEPYDPEKMFPEEEDEEYDPETAFPPISPKTDDNTPYDPEDNENLLAEDEVDSKEVKELVEKQAFIEKMQRELEEKKAKLAQVEQSLQQTPTPVEKPRIADPRLARRAAVPALDASKPPNSHQPVLSPATSVSQTSTTSVAYSTITTPASTAPSPTASSAQDNKSTEVKDDSHSSSPQSLAPKLPAPDKPADPLQTILSVLNMKQPKSASSNPTVVGALKVFQKQSSPDPSPAVDPVEQEESGGSSKKDHHSDVRHGDQDKEKQKNREHKRHRSSSVSSSSSREESRRRHRHDHDDAHHSKRHKRSRSKSPHRHGRHHRRHDLSHGRDRDQKQ